MERWLKFRVVNGATMKTLGFSAKVMEVKYYSKTCGIFTLTIKVGFTDIGNSDSPQLRI